MTLAVSGDNITFADNSVQATAATGFGFKNRIINGGCVIDQRNAGAAVTTGSSFPVDRFKLAIDTGSQSAQRSTTTAANFVNSLALTITTGASPIVSAQNSIRHIVEGFNISDFGWGTSVAQPATLSFWARSSITGTFSGSVMNGAYNRSFVFTYTINVANTFEYKTVAITGDTSGTWATDNSAGIRLNFDTGSGTNYNGTASAWNAGEYYRAAGAVQLVATTGAVLYITGVQLEKGSTATAFDYRPYGTELALCQRYYEIARGGQTIAGTTSAISTNVSCAVEKRAAPTVTLVANLYRDNTATTSPSNASINVRGSRFIWTPSNTNSAEYHVEFSYAAEL